MEGNSSGLIPLWVSTSTVYIWAGWSELWEVHRGHVSHTSTYPFHGPVKSFVNVARWRPTVVKRHISPSHLKRASAAASSGHKYSCRHANVNVQSAAPDLKVYSVVLMLSTTVRASLPSAGNRDTCSLLTAEWWAAWTSHRSHTWEEDTFTTCSCSTGRGPSPERHSIQTQRSPFHFQLT